MGKTLEKLVAQCVWANRRLVDFLITEKIEEPGALRLACHIAHGESAWFQRIYAQTVNPDIFKPIPLPELRALFDAHAKLFDEQLRADLTRVIAYKRFNGDEYQSSIEDILLHLCTHGFHHRAQIASLVSKMGICPPQQDYINFCRVEGV